MKKVKKEPEAPKIEGMSVQVPGKLHYTLQFVTDVDVNRIHAVGIEYENNLFNQMAAISIVRTLIEQILKADASMAKRDSWTPEERKEYKTASQVLLEISSENGDVMIPQLQEYVKRIEKSAPAQG